MPSPKNLIPHSYSLELALFSTFDLDLGYFREAYPNLEADKVIIIRGDGDYIETGGEALSDQVTLVAYEGMGVTLQNEKELSVKYHHPKLQLFIYQNKEGERLAYLSIGSKNVFRYENIEGFCSFFGKYGENKQRENEPLCEYLRMVIPFASDDQGAKMNHLLSLLPYFRFKGLETFSEFEEYSFLIPNCRIARFLNDSYDELLIVAPFIQLGPLTKILSHQKECGRTLVWTSMKEALPLFLSLPALPDFFFTNEERYLHAKVYLMKKNGIYDLFIGSMNISDYSINRNDEVLVHLHNVKGIDSLESFLSSFFGLSEKTVKESLLRFGEKKETQSVYETALNPNVRLQYLKKLDYRRGHNRDYLNKVFPILFAPSCGKMADLLLHNENYPSTPLRTEVRIQGKTRLVHHVPYEEKVILGLINHSLHQYDDRFSPNVYLHLAGRGINDVFRAIKNTPDFENMHLFRTDIHAFDPSMDTGVLRNCILDTFPDNPEVASFLIKIVSSHRYTLSKGGEIHHDGDAVQSGLPLCGYLENIYLRDFDNVMESKADFYARCGDDVLMGCKNREKLEALATEAISLLIEKKLTVSAKKTMLASPDEEIDYLGLSLKDGKVDFSSKTLSSIQKAIKAESNRLFAYYGRKRIPPVLRLPSLVRYANSRLGQDYFQGYFKVITTDEGLRKIDSMVLDMIRAIASGKTGKGRYAIGYKDIHRFGYKSLVFLYYSYINRNKK